MDKKIKSRLRRGSRARAKIRRLGEVRLTVTRTPRHIYAQVIAPSGSEVLASASTLDKELRTSIKYSGNVESASLVGKLVAERAVKAGVSKVAFDRSGHKYHGRIKALANSARENGLQF